MTSALMMPTMVLRPSSVTRSSVTGARGTPLVAIPQKRRRSFHLRLNAADFAATEGKLAGAGASEETTASEVGLRGGTHQQQRFVDGSAPIVGRRGAGLAAAAAAAALVGLASSPGAAFAAAASTLDSVIELTPANFAAEVEAPGAGRVFVEFYAPWCPFCQRLEPVWSELPSKLAAAQVSTKVARMNVDTYTKYGETYGITGFPTLMLFQDGRPVGQKTGLIDMSTAMRYAGVKDAGLLASAASAPPPPQMNLVLTGPQVDRAMEELSALRRDVEATLPEGAEARGSALERIKKVELLFASRSL
eukprot:CAMPEP_0197587702 /NCGR_PEP_ID=MMETSP1326-20131121/9234_1 /TAXON_ID=1155430 /ORGANISM="Genus nov. species nov., Strain RCC2288" /LENGTH=304 /DNA_ID=CAMNT_0043152459 /DNA_START=218 /DNA_END=1132 /DNA_ORIENTATION=+